MSCKHREKFCVEDPSGKWSFYVCNACGKFRQAFGCGTRWKRYLPSIRKGCATPDPRQLVIPVAIP